jgi:hypothetical protein
MRKITLSVFVTILCLNGFGQNAQALPKVDTSRASVEYWNKWTNDLYDMGVNSNKDSFFVRGEVMQLLSDSAYRQAMYPEKYQWPAAIELMNKMELKKAFWHLINLYQTDTPRRNMIVRTFVLYDSLIDMDKALLSAYYTYAFSDPRVTRVVKGRPEIYRPDILEQGLAATKEIAGYIWYYRKNKAEAKK